MLLANRLGALVALALLDAALVVACSSSSSDSSPESTSGGASANAHCPSSRSPVDLGKCDRQESSHVYNCPNDPSFPPSSCYQEYVFPCGLPAGSVKGGSDAAIDAGDAGDAGVSYDCAVLCAGAVDTRRCNVSLSDGSTVVRVFCGASACGA